MKIHLSTNLETCSFHWKLHLIWTFLLSAAVTVNSDAIHSSKSLFFSSVQNLIQTAVSGQVAMPAPVWLPSLEMQVHTQCKITIELVGLFCICCWIPAMSPADFEGLSSFWVQPCLLGL